MVPGMGKHTLYVVGRNKDCEIVLEDQTVSRQHLEVVVTADGRYYLTDMNSSGGTAVLRNNEWIAVRQAYVEKTDQIRLGELLMTVQELAIQINNYNSSSGSAAGKKPGSGAEWNAKDELPEGPVKRDRITGEIIGD
jgi:predicted component of type VI protein secretion system